MRWRNGLVILVLLGGTPAFAANLADTEAQLKATRAKADVLALKLKVSERDMESVRKRATELASALQRNEAALTKSERRMNQLERDVAEREERLAMRRDQSTRTMLAMLKVERMPASALFAQPGNATDMLRTAAALQAARESLARDAARLRAELSGLKESKESLATTRTKARNETESLRARRGLLDADLKRRSEVDKQLRLDQQAANADAARLSRESKSLQELVNKVEAKPVTAAPFGRRGSLSAPVAGEVVHRFGERKDASDTYRGLVLSSRAGAVVVAPSAGEVAFTGPFMDYGPMVLVRHAGGYMSLLAGLGSIDARIGQKLGAGEPIGRMGGGAPKLYVELRSGGKPIDPSGWFANVGKSLAAR